MIIKAIIITKSEIIEQAEKIACEMNINDMDASNN